MNLRWPAGPDNDLAPWFVIAWRALWWPLIVAGIWMAACGIGMALGAKRAGEWLKDAT